MTSSERQPLLPTTRSNNNHDDNLDEEAQQQRSSYAEESAITGLSRRSCTVGALIVPILLLVAILAYWVDGGAYVAVVRKDDADSEGHHPLLTSLFKKSSTVNPIDASPSPTIDNYSNNLYRKHDEAFDLWEAWKDKDLLRLASQHHSTSSSTITAPPPSNDLNTNSDNDPSTIVDWLHHTWESSTETAQNLWQHIRGSSMDAEHSTQQWWDKTSDETRVWFNDTELETQGWWNDTEHQTQQWWHHSVHSEQEWQDTTSHELQTFGRRIKSWWNDTTKATQSKSQVLERNFVDWWKRAGEADRLWWNDTVEAFGRFGERTADTTGLWWNLTRHAVHSGWDTTVETEEDWWHATKEWFANHTAALKPHRNSIRNANNPNQEVRELLYFNSTRAFQMLTTQYGWFDQSSHFFYLQRGWDTQVNQAYCGVASISAVLNSLKDILQSDELPLDPIYHPYPFATQSSLVRDTCVHKHVVRVDDAIDGILSFPGGLSLDQTGRILECYLYPSWNVSVVHVDATLPLDDVARDMIRALHDPQSRVIVNFHRQALGQLGGGHYSPLAAYHAQEHKVLLMDVAKYKYPPVWVPIERLYLAMQTEDRCGAYPFPIQSSEEEVLVNITKAYRSNVSEHRIEKLFRQASDVLHCEPAYRGYIVVQQG